MRSKAVALEEEEMDDNETDQWKPLHEKDLKEPYLTEVQRFFDRGNSQDYAAFNTIEKRV